MSVPDSPMPPRRPNRHKVVLLTWCGIWPVITLVLSQMLPLLQGKVPLPVLTLCVTAIVVPTMGYLVMPNLTRWCSNWLHR